MPEKRRKFDAEFREGAVRLVRETGKPIAAIARDLGVNEGTLGNWVVKDKAARDGVEGLSRYYAAELKRLRAENAELRMERDVLKRSVVLWVKPTRGPTIECRTRSRACCWGLAWPGSTSGGAGRRRRGNSAGPTSMPPSRPCSTMRKVCTARPGCTPTSAMRVG